MHGLIDLMGAHSHMHVGARKGRERGGCGGWVGTEDMLGRRSSTTGHQIRALPSDQGCDGMDRKCVGVCVSAAYHPLYSEIFGEERMKGCGGGSM